MSSVDEKATKKPTIKAQIEQVKVKHEELSKNLSAVKFPADILPEVTAFISELRSMGREVPPGANRDLLISLASFWATYYFQHSEENTYPATTLEPYLGPSKGDGTETITGVFQKMINKGESSTGWGTSTAVESSAPEAAAKWYFSLPLVGRILVAAVPLLVIALVAFLALRGNGGSTAVPTQTLQNIITTPDLSGTQVAMDLTATSQTSTGGEPLGTLVAMATQTAISASGETLVPTEEQPTIVAGTLPPLPTELLATQPEAGGPGIENLGVSVSIDNLNDLQEVLPLTYLNVSFSNFSPGWSVHLLLQPLSKGLTYYPIPDYFLVEKGYGSGLWTAAVNLGTGTDLDQREQYAITPVMATSEAARQALEAAVESGFDQLPEGVFTSPQLITRVYTVVRQAYKVINEIRVVYSAYPANTPNTDLFAILPDGSDPVQLTDTPEISERYPSISPTGSHIAFVGRSQINRDAPRVYTLWIMSSDGTNRFSIAQDPALIYDRPLWSPEGNLIAYNTSPADATMTGALASWGIYLYDLLSGQTFPLETGLTYARHPTWAPDGKSLYFSALNPESGTLGIYQISLDTQEVRRVYDEKGNEIQPMVSPDGSRLMFLDFDTREIYIMDLASGALEMIETPKSLDLGYAVWSPNGEAICFEVNINSSYTIWWLKLSDMSGRQLTEGVTELDPTVGLLSVFLPK